MPTKNILLDCLQEGQRPTVQIASDATAATLVASATGGLLLQVTATNTTVADAWLQIHNTAALPANGSVPLISLKVLAGATVDFDTPVTCDTGITLAGSTTAATLTTGSSFLCFALLRK